MVSKPAILSPSSTLADAAGLISSLDVSQIPVYDGGDYIGLFTTNAMARWISHAIQEGEGTLLKENVAVSEILDHCEAHERAEFEKPTAPALKACEDLSRETSPSVLLVTTDGTSAGQLQGLVTKFDIPRILRRVTVSFH